MHVAGGVVMGGERGKLVPPVLNGKVFQLILPLQGTHARHRVLHIVNGEPTSVSMYAVGTGSRVLPHQRRDGEDR